jgi:ElaB/YqjD/DUF883 family membrane-anchored ribosome-binding protein
MAETEDLAPSRATPTPRRSSNGSSRPRRAARARDDDLETQISQLQTDIKAITNTLTRLGENKVGEVRSTAARRAADLRGKGEEMIETAQDEFGAFERQIKDTIREKPLTAVAGAIALGFLIAVITR